MESLPNHGCRETVRYAPRKAPIVAVTARTKMRVESSTAGYATPKPSGIALEHILKISITNSNINITVRHNYLI